MTGMVATRARSWLTERHDEGLRIQPLSGGALEGVAPLLAGAGTEDGFASRSLPQRRVGGRQRNGVVHNGSVGTGVRRTVERATEHTMLSRPTGRETGRGTRTRRVRKEPRTVPVEVPPHVDVKTPGRGDYRMRGIHVD